MLPLMITCHLHHQHCHHTIFILFIVSIVISVVIVVVVIIIIIIMVIVTVTSCIDHVLKLVYDCDCFCCNFSGKQRSKHWSLQACLPSVKLLCMLCMQVPSMLVAIWLRLVIWKLLMCTGKWIWMWRLKYFHKIGGEPGHIMAVCSTASIVTINYQQVFFFF